MLPQASLEVAEVVIVVVVVAATAAAVAKVVASKAEMLFGLVA